jgi:hypothetical protein
MKGNDDRSSSEGSTFDLGSRNFVGRLATVSRYFHLATVFWLMP